MLPDGWKDWKTCLDNNLYIRLGLDPKKADSHSVDDVNQAYKKRYEWLIKRIASKNNPKWEGRFDLAVKSLQEANLVLSNPQKKQDYDRKLLKESKQDVISNFLMFTVVPPIKKDKILTPEEEENIIDHGLEMGILEHECKDLIEKTLDKFGASRALPKKRTTDVMDLYRETIIALATDGWLEPKEIKHLKQTAQKYGIPTNEAESAINDIVNRKKIKIGKRKQLNIPQKEAAKNYYELLAITETAEIQEVEIAYKKMFNKWNALASNPNYRDHVSPMKELLKEVRDTLIDRDRRNEYDQKLEHEDEEDEILFGEVPGIPKIKITDDFGNKKLDFIFRNIQQGTTQSQNFTVYNEGGGTLDAKIEFSAPWLVITPTSKIHQSKLPQTFSIAIDPNRDKRCELGFREKETIEIEYKQGNKSISEFINVDFTMEGYNSALKRFRTIALPPIFIISGLIGFFIYNISLQAGTFFSNLFSLAVIIGGVFFAAYKARNEGFGGVARNGCISLIIIFIFLLILELISPKAFVFAVWSFFISGIFFVFSKRLYIYQKKLIPFIFSVLLLVTAIGVVANKFSHVPSSAPIKIKNAIKQDTQEKGEPIKNVPPVRKPPPKKTEEDEFNDVYNNPNLDNFIYFEKKYPTSVRIGELINRIKSADPNLPPEKWWNKRAYGIRNNNMGFWEMNHRKLIWLIWIPPKKLAIQEAEKPIGQKIEVARKGFWIGKYEVSVEQYKRYCVSSGISPPTNMYYRDNQPMRNVSWDDAIKFCTWIGCRLPTESEWEIAARGGTNYKNFPWGNEFNPIHCNVNTNDVTEIGTWTQNGYGLFNIMGNVKEWSHDWYSEGKATQSEAKLYRVIKGSSFRDTPKNVGITKRDYMFPSYKKDSYGLRVAMD